MKNAYKLINEYEKAKIDAFFELKDVKELLANIKTEDVGDAGFTRLIISSEHVDRTGEIVRQDGLNSDLYMKNPVILNSHNYYGIENIVGKTTKLYKEVINGVPCTLADGVWAPTEAGQMAKQLWDAKCLSAASVGFIPEEFDANNASVITKWQLLEYSMVPVPANGEAVRDSYKALAEQFGITESAIRMKGFDIKREPTGEAEEGDECSMTDGTIGVFPKQGGKLVCVPSDAKAIKTTPETGGDKDPSESSMWEDLKAEHAFHEKAVKSHVEEYVKGAKAEAEKKPEEGDDETATEEKRLKSLEMHKKKLKAVMKAEHERHIKSIEECIKGYEKKPDDDSDDQSGQENQDDHDVDNEKMVAAVKGAFPDATDEQVKAITKAAATMSDAMHKKLKTLCESIEEGHAMHTEGGEVHTKAIDEFKALLAEHEPSEGDDTPEGDPEKRSTPAVAADLLPEEIVKLARELNTATRDALTRFNHEQSRKG